MGTKFGSGKNAEWIGIVSANENTNCTSYNSAGVQVDNEPTSTGANQIFKTGFDLGDNTQYLAGPWKVECDVPVFGIFDDAATSDETMSFTHVQMRQYIHPEPVISIR
jgi:hypothetical protein